MSGEDPGRGPSCVARDRDLRGIVVMPTEDTACFLQCGFFHSRKLWDCREWLAAFGVPP